MIRELGWYLESGRFSSIVGEIESLAGSYAAAISSEASDKDRKRHALADMIFQHAAVSGLSLGAEPNVFVDETLFRGGVLNREALDRLEKDIVKAHMYQKHLWDYMGTMSIYTPISKRAMERDGYDYSDYLPLSYKVEHQAKSPISGIVGRERNAVAIYAYSDGFISSSYDSKKARISLDALRDNSGFDWRKKGWDPNYEIDKRWRGTFNENGEWIEDDGAPQQAGKAQVAASFGSLAASMQVIRAEDGVILYDPFYEFLLSYMAFRYSHGEGEESAEDERIGAAVSSIKSAMQSFGASRISAIVRNPYANRFSDRDKKDVPHFAEMVENDGKVAGVYKSIFGDLIADDVEFKEIGEARRIQRDFEDKYKSEARKRKGEELALKFGFAISQGLKGDDAVDAVFTMTAPMPLNRKVVSDLQFAGLDEGEISQIAALDVPQEKSQAFDRALFNALESFGILESSGYSKSELIRDVYDSVVLGVKLEKEMDVETSLDEVFANGLKGLPGDGVSNEEKLEFEEVSKEILAQAHPSYRSRLAVWLENCEKGYPIVKRNTNASPSQLLIKARDEFRKRYAIAADVGITYRTSAKKEAQEERIRLFDTVNIADFISKSLESEERRRRRDYSFEISEFASSGGKTAMNLFFEPDEDAFLRSDAFKGSQISEEKIREVIENERSSFEATLEADGRASANAVASVPIPAVAEMNRLARIEPVEGLRSGSAYLTDVLGADYSGPDFFSEASLFFAYLMSDATRQVNRSVADDGMSQEIGSRFRPRPLEGQEAERRAKNSQIDRRDDALRSAKELDGKQERGKGEYSDFSGEVRKDLQVALDADGSAAGKASESQSAIDRLADAGDRNDAADGRFEAEAASHKEPRLLDSEGLRETERQASSADRRESASPSIKDSLERKVGLEQISGLDGEEDFEPGDEEHWDAAQVHRSKTDRIGGERSGDGKKRQASSADRRESASLSIKDSLERKVGLEQISGLDGEEDFESGEEEYQAESGRESVREFIIMNELARDYEHKLPTEFRKPSSEAIGKRKGRIGNYIDRVRRRKERQEVLVTPVADEKIDAMLKEWAIAEGFTYYDVKSKRVVYDKGLAVYGFSKRFKGLSYSEHFASVLAKRDLVDDALNTLADGRKASAILSETPSYSPSFTGYPDFNKKVGKGEKGEAKGAGKSSRSVESADEEEKIRRSTERYLIDRKQMDPFTESCIKEINESKMKAQAERAERVLVSGIISSLKSRIK